MNIVIGSAFRDSAGRQVTRYLEQVMALKIHAGPAHTVRVIAAEGDSKDFTRLELLSGAAKLGLSFEVVNASHGGPRYSSTESTDRLTALSKVGNTIFDAVKDSDDVLVYVESDLIWDAHTIGSLIDAAYEARGGFTIFAPLVFAGSHFYDVWAYRGLDGERFSPFAPYHRSLQRTGFTEVSSAGSCLVMRAKIARTVRITDDNALVGWCLNARKEGCQIAVWPEFRIEHPA